MFNKKLIIILLIVAHYSVSSVSAKLYGKPKARKKSVQSKTRKLGPRFRQIDNSEQRSNRNEDQEPKRPKLNEADRALVKGHIDRVRTPEGIPLGNGKGHKHFDENDVVKIDVDNGEPKKEQPTEKPEKLFDYR